MTQPLSSSRLFVDDSISFQESSQNNDDPLKAKSQINKELLSKFEKDYPEQAPLKFSNRQELFDSYQFEKEVFPLPEPNLEDLNERSLFAPPLGSPLKFSTYEELIKTSESYAEFLFLAKYPEERKEAPRLREKFSSIINHQGVSPQITPHPQWRTHIVNKGGFALEYNAAQQKYGSYMAQSIESAFESSDKSFDYILSFFCFARSLMTPHAMLFLIRFSGPLFGAPVFEPCSHYFLERFINDKGSSTSLNGTYKELSLHYQSDIFLNAEPSAETLIPIDRYGQRGYLVVGDMDGEKIPLSRIFPKIVYHTRPECVAKILKHVETLYDAAMEENNRENVIESSAKIFWWLCQAKFVLRGDPSIAEMIVSLIFKQHGLEFPGWAKNCIPWAEVMKSFSPEEFVTKFPDILHSDPLKRSSDWIKA